MKKGALLIICGMFAMGFARAQTAISTPKSTDQNPKQDILQLKETTHDFGMIPQGRPVTHTFDVVNTGSEPLLLENVQASCGCTTPEWGREPIAPGATVPIKVGYNAYAEGHFNKTVTIFYNNAHTKALTITGEVYKLPPSSAPENASVQFLKQTNQ
jgi:hypothetical protein